ncbi:MAG: hypothetical protein IKZ98_04710 [Clostridia bacterium]|nr:hypothetical protein [Clostridia bacterium]
MRIDTFGLPVPVTHRDKANKRIPLTFRRPSKAEAREQEMENLRKICGFRTSTEQEAEERASGVWKKCAGKTGWDKEEEKEK